MRRETKQLTMTNHFYNLPEELQQKIMVMRPMHPVAQLVQGYWKSVAAMHDFSMTEFSCIQCDEDVRKEGSYGCEWCVWFKCLLRLRAYVYAYLLRARSMLRGS